MLPGYFESLKAIHIFPVLSRWAEFEWKIFLLRSEFALSYRFNIFLPQVNVHIIVPYLIKLNLGAFWSLPVRWGPFESQMLLSPGVGSALLQRRGWIRAGSRSGWLQPLPGSAWRELGECWQRAEGSGAKGGTWREAVLHENSAGSSSCQPFPCAGCNSVPGECIAWLTAGCVSPQQTLSVHEGLVLGLFWDRRARQGDLLNNKPSRAAASLRGVTQSPCHPFPSNLHIKVTRPEISRMSCSWPRPDVQPVLLGRSWLSADPPL